MNWRLIVSEVKSEECGRVCKVEDSDKTEYSGTDPICLQLMLPS